MASQPPGAAGGSSTTPRRRFPLAVQPPVPTSVSAGPSPRPAFDPSVLSVLFTDDELTAEEIADACANLERDITLSEGRQTLGPVKTIPAEGSAGVITPPSGHTSGSATPLSDMGAVLLQASDAHRATAVAAGEQEKKKTRRGRRGGRKTQARRAAAIAEGRPPHLPLRRQAQLQAHLQTQLAAVQGMPRPHGVQTVPLAPADVIAIAMALRAQAFNVHITSCGILF